MYRSPCPYEPYKRWHSTPKSVQYGKVVQTGVWKEILHFVTTRGIVYITTKLATSTKCSSSFSCVEGSNRWFSTAALPPNLESVLHLLSQAYQYIFHNPAWRWKLRGLTFEQVMTTTPQK